MNRLLSILLLLSALSVQGAGNDITARKQLVAVPDVSRYGSTYTARGIAAILPVSRSVYMGQGSSSWGAFSGIHRIDIDTAALIFELQVDDESIDELDQWNGVVYAMGGDPIGATGHIYDKTAGSWTQHNTISASHQSLLKVWNGTNFFTTDGGVTNQYPSIAIAQPGIGNTFTKQDISVSGAHVIRYSGFQVGGNLYVVRPKSYDAFSPPNKFMLKWTPQYATNWQTIYSLGTSFRSPSVDISYVQEIGTTVVIGAGNGVTYTVPNIESNSGLTALGLTSSGSPVVGLWTNSLAGGIFLLQQTGTGVTRTYIVYTSPDGTNYTEYFRTDMDVNNSFPSIRAAPSPVNGAWWFGETTTTGTSGRVWLLSTNAISGYGTGTNVLLSIAANTNATTVTTNVQETGGSFTFSLLRSPNQTGSALTVDLSYGGSAVAGTDYTAGPSSVTFASGDYRTNVTIALLDNAIAGGDHTLSIGLSANANFTPDYPSSLSYVIANDDTNTVTTAATALPALGRGRGR